MLNLNNDPSIAYLWQEIWKLFVKKEPGKGLSTEDFTAEEKRKLAELGGTGGPYVSLGSREQIPGNADLNSYLRPGSFACASAEIAGTLQNCPVKFGFILDVFNAIGGAEPAPEAGKTTYWVQELTLYSGSKYIRRFTCSKSEQPTLIGAWVEYTQQYAVGDIFVTTRAGNPAGLLGYGTWSQIKDRFLLAAGDSYAAGSTGGEATHTLTEAELAGHEGHLSSNAENWGGSATTLYLNQDTMKVWGTDGRGWNRQAGTEIVPAGHTKGSSQPHNNMPPYLAVYMWLRTA